MITGSFNNHVFEISPEVMRSFDTLAITAGSDTDDKTADGEKYVTHKNAKVKKVTLNVTLSAQLGCNPREESAELTDEACAGQMGYLYIGDKKLFTCLMMLTDANTSDIAIAPNGAWISCKVALTFQQASKNDGGFAKEKPKKDDDDDDEDDEEKKVNAELDDPILNLKQQKRWQLYINSLVSAASSARLVNTNGGNARIDRIQVK